MAYKHFDNTKPDGALDPGPETLTALRENLHAMSDAVLMGVMPGWNMIAAGGTPEQPTDVQFLKGLEIIQGLLVWGASGGSDGNVTQITFNYSPDSIAVDNIGVVTITYDNDGNATSAIWS